MARSTDDIHAAFHHPPQSSEFLWQVPALKGRYLIQRIDLLLDQRQAMHRIEDDVFPFPAPGMAGDGLAATANHHFVDIAPDPDILMAVGDRDGIVVPFSLLQMIGPTPVALPITVIVAMWLLRGEQSGSAIEKIMDGALGPVGAIILVTGAGGMFGGVLRASGIGQALADSINALGRQLIVVAFVVASAFRVAHDSATVALTTTAGLLAPTVAATTADRARSPLPRHRHSLRLDGPEPGQ